MSNYLTNLADNRIEGKSLTVRPIGTTKKIVSRMLDGSFTVQQIGSESTRLQVTLVVQDKSILNNICSICEPIKLIYYDKIYTGLITSEEITWSPVNVGNRRYRGAFEVAVTEVIDR